MACRFLSVFAFLGVVSLAACTSAPSEDFDLSGGNKDGGMRCTPGDTQECICLGGGTGTQTCRASGSSYGTCTSCTTLFDGGGSADMAQGPCGNCDGCCDGTTCLPFAMETNMKCGVRGTTCSMCTGGKVCSTMSGMCVDSACMSCPNGHLCTGGTCTDMIDPNADFTISVTQIRLRYYDYTSDPVDGDYWDGFLDDDPEPQAKFYYQSGGSLIEGYSDYQGADDNAAQMTRDVNFSPASPVMKKGGGGAFTVKGSVLIAGTLRVVGLDNDSGVNLTGDDVAADFFFPATNMIKASYSTGAKDSLVELVFQIK